MNKILFHALRFSGSFTSYMVAMYLIDSTFLKSVLIGVLIMIGFEIQDIKFKDAKGRNDDD